jgi:hypothetical protein
MSDSPGSTTALSLHDRLNGLKDWQFTFVLYLLRWAIVLPLGLLLSLFANSGDGFKASSSDPWFYFLPFLVIAPPLETLIECTLPYLLMYKGSGHRPKSPWPFVIVSALIMVVLHSLTPIVITFAFITGAFLAYVYVHFAPQSQVKAFFHTALFHAGINLVGWTTLLIQSGA